MSFRDELAQLPERNGPSSWKMDLILAQLSPEEAEELKEILADESIYSSDIAKVLKSRNLPISERAVQRYRSENVFT